MKKIDLKNVTMNERDLPRANKYNIYPKDFKIIIDLGFVNIDNGSQNGTHWTCFVVKDNTSYYFDSFGCQPDIFLLNHLPQPIIYLYYKIQDINPKLCGYYCFYFFYLIERMKYNDTNLKKYFEDQVD